LRRSRAKLAATVGNLLGKLRHAGQRHAESENGRLPKHIEQHNFGIGNVDGTQRRQRKVCAVPFAHIGRITGADSVDVRHHARGNRNAVFVVLRRGQRTFPKTPDGCSGSKDPTDQMARRKTSGRADRETCNRRT